jgi:hypothetical protein
MRRRDRREGEALHTCLRRREQQKQWGGVSGARDTEMPCDGRLGEKKVERAMTIEVTTSI